MNGRQRRPLRIGGASGYWGDAPHATAQLLRAHDLDVLVCDYLAEITMAILAKSRAADPAKGYAADFVSQVIKPHARDIAERGIKVIANAGGVNPQACALAVRQSLAAQSIDLNVAVVIGDDMMARVGDFARLADMDSGAPFPDRAKVISSNAYLGAFPISRALDEGADIVITGRVVDSATTLGALIHHFGWSATDLDLLSAGALAGHLIECGVQVSGGNHTDWQDVGDLATLGYPIAEVLFDGTIVITKAPQTTGRVTKATVAEQLLYEIGDPGAYLLPDVSCDWRSVELEDIAPDEVRISGARGAMPPPSLKLCTTYLDGHRVSLFLPFYGTDAAKRARAVVDAAFTRAADILRSFNMPPIENQSVEVIGGGDLTGVRPQMPADEVCVKVAASHEDPKALGILLKSINGMGLATAPGLTGSGGVVARPTPMVKLHSALIPRDTVTASVEIGDKQIDVPFSPVEGSDVMTPATMVPEAVGEVMEELISVPLVDLAFTRSGDKGDKGNVGIYPRDPRFLPFIWASLDETSIAKAFAHVLDDTSGVQTQIERFYLPGLPAMNILMRAALGGGGTGSLRTDPQGKGYSQIALAMPVQVPKALISAARAA